MLGMVVHAVTYILLRKLANFFREYESKKSRMLWTRLFIEPSNDVKLRDIQR